ncbi:MAG: hypothetical protein Q4B17_01100 [Lautropia sp.]|nr:hypothetical protein [Lautropia sp.]
MLSAAWAAFLLKEQPFDRFDFPRWQAVLGISLLGALVGLDPATVAAEPNVPIVALAWLGLLLLWGAFLTSYWFMRWWMKRGGRWDGRGDLFNLMAAAWFVVNLVGCALSLLGVPMILLMPIWLFSIWVLGNALSGAIPKASLGYSIVGILLAGVPVTLVMLVLAALFGFVAMALGWVSVPSGDGSLIPVG